MRRSTGERWRYLVVIFVWLIFINTPHHIRAEDHDKKLQQKQKPNIIIILIDDMVSLN